METALLFAINRTVTGAPWYFIACVPFMDTRRMGKRAVALTCCSVLALRVLVGYLIDMYVPDFRFWDGIWSNIHSLLMVAAYYLIFKVNIVKLIYVMLMVFSLASFTNYLAGVVILPHIPVGMPIVSTPQYLIAGVMLMPFVLPPIYKTFNSLLRRAFSELSDKTFWSLCITPLMFFLLLNIHNFVMLSAKGLDNMAVAITRLFILLTGFVSFYLHIRMILDNIREHRLTAENAALDSANRLKADIMATIAHETRTPIAVISSYTELIAMELRAQGVSERHAQDLDSISDEIQHIGRLMEEMQGLSKARDAQKSRVSVTDIISRTARLYEHILARNKILLRVELPNSLPPVCANPGEVTQVLLNILKNAGSHTRDGTITILAQITDDERYIETIIIDTGVGIEPELLPTVFERGVSGSENGTGIGLSVCRTIINAHGGTISIESEPDNGTMVRFTLPIFMEDNDCE